MRWAIMLLMISTILISACGGSTGNATQSFVEILRVDPACPPDNVSMSNCCKEQCSDLCSRNRLPAVKNERNGVSCACWCG